MINEPQIIELMITKIWKPVQKHASLYDQNLVPYFDIYEILGRRGFCKNETRMLGHFFQSKGLIIIAKHGWLISSEQNSQA